MSRFPSELIILGTKYQVLYFNDEREVDEDKKDRLRGQVNYDKHEIRVLIDKRSSECIWRTLWHEIIHIFLEEMDLKRFVKEREHLVDVLSLAFQLFWQQNDFSKLEGTFGSREKFGESSPQK